MNGHTRQAIRHPAYLALLIVAALVIVVVVHRVAISRTEVPYSQTMHQATALCSDWYDVIGDFKQSRGVVSNSGSVTRYSQLIGDDYSPMTTTLGSLEAKETAANPEFAALITRLCIEAGIDSSSTVGIILSGSFPSLSIASMAAVQTIGAKPVVVSSLGASTYGANQPDATWIDMEHYLHDHADMLCESRMVTIGAENDRGDGLMEEGVADIRAAAARCGVSLFEPTDLDDAIAKKLSVFTSANVDLLINIGGNQSALGRCPHASTYPNGLHMHLNTCTCPERGVVARLADRGVPIIHLLNIKDLASQHGLPISPGADIAPSTGVYVTEQVIPAGPAAGIIVLLGLVLSGRLWRIRSKRAKTAQANSRNMG